MKKEFSWAEGLSCWHEREGVERERLQPPKPKAKRLALEREEQEPGWGMKTATGGRPAGRESLLPGPSGCDKGAWGKRDVTPFPHVQQLCGCPRRRIWTQHHPYALPTPGRNLAGSTRSKAHTCQERRTVGGILCEQWAQPISFPSFPTLLPSGHSSLCLLRGSS